MPPLSAEGPQSMPGLALMAEEEDKVDTATAGREADSAPVRAGDAVTARCLGGAA